MLLRFWCRQVCLIRTITSNSQSLNLPTSLIWISNILLTVIQSFLMEIKTVYFYVFFLYSYLLSDIEVWFFLAHYPQELKSMLNGSAPRELSPALLFSDSSKSLPCSQRDGWVCSMSTFYAGDLQLNLTLSIYEPWPYLSLNKLTEVFNNAAKRSVWHYHSLPLTWAIL